MKSRTNILAEAITRVEKLGKAAEEVVAVSATISEEALSMAEEADKEDWETASQAVEISMEVREITETAIRAFKKSIEEALRRLAYERWMRY